MENREEIQKRELEEALMLTEAERRELLVLGQEELKHVDFDVLRKIYEEIVRRSGENSEKMNFCVLESVSVASDPYMDLGEYSPDTKTLMVNVTHEGFPHNKSGEKNELDPGLFARVFLGVLIHEETHATGDKFPCRSEKELDQIAEQMTRADLEMQVSGFRTIRSKTGKFFVGFSLLDEAVTDLVGEEVFAEYLKRTGDRARYTSRNGSSKYPHGYSGGRKCVAALIERAARAAELPEEVVWNALKQGYYNKSDTTLQDLRALLGEALNKTIAEALERVPADNPESINQLLSTLTPSEDDVSELVVPLMKLEQSRVIAKEMRQ